VVWLRGYHGCLASAKSWGQKNGKDKYKEDSFPSEA
jgi:hypothetical protein